MKREFQFILVALVAFEGLASREMTLAQEEPTVRNKDPLNCPFNNSAIIFSVRSPFEFKDLSDALRYYDGMIHNIGDKYDTGVGASLYFDRALINAAMRQHNDALSDLAQFQKRRPHSPADVLLLRFFIERENGQQEDCLKDIGEAIKICPNDSALYRLRQQLLTSIGRKDDAAQDRRTILGLSKKSPPSAPSACAEFSCTVYDFDITLTKIRLFQK